MQIIKGNILDVKSGIIAHQCNCMGRMGSGLAKSIAVKYPEVKADYENHFARGRLSLGKVNFSKVSLNNELWVAHLCGQSTYGREPNKVYTSYEALAQCFRDLNNNTGPQHSIYVPYGIGCGLAGGDWNIVSKMLEDYLPRATVVQL